MFLVVKGTCFQIWMWQWLTKLGHASFFSTLLSFLVKFMGIGDFGAWLSVSSDLLAAIAGAIGTAEAMDIIHD